MKYRDYKQFTEGKYYHVYNRGNNKQNIFKESADYQLFLSRLRENLFPKMPFQRASSERKQLPEGAFSLVCYCLMPNHFHLLIKQHTELPISKLLSKICTSYSKYFNIKYEQTGQVFEDQFKAISVDDDNYLILLSAYIHSNPLVAGLVDNLKAWQWSSYGEYFRNESQAICDTHIISEKFISIEDHMKFILERAELIRERKNIEHLLLD